jgi:Holliday junction resolvase RusA-like endonuclease
VNFFIPGELTTLNQYIAAMNANRYDGAKIKKMETQRVMIACRDIPPVEQYPVNLRLTWYRQNQRSDSDNISFAIKFVLDGLQEAGVLRQDTWACIKSIHHEFAIDRNNPGVEVVIE